MPYVLPTPSPTAETFPRVPPTVTTRASSELSTGPGFDVDSNTANAALPLLPRHRPVPRLETPEDESDDHPVVDLDDSSNASSSTVTGISVPKLSVSTSRPRRIRGQRMPGSKPVAEDTPESPTPTPADSIPFPTFNSRNHLTVHKPVSPGRAGTLRLNLEALRRTYSESQVPSTAPCTVANPAAIPYVRKKSGELVKPSLKQCQAYAGHRSVPTTPTTPKSVHFDSQLEHVKLFLAEQKPLAVSRDGSPEETSEAEDSDRYPYPGSSEDERIRSTLTMEICNMPSIPRLHDECRLESIKLAHDKSGIEGQVIVRNIAFSKWVAIRFTFDDWQTTSEVTGRYVSSLDGGAYDRFAFVIKLGDVLPRVHEKTLLMAIRYSVAGRDIWDNNAGQNYRFTFKRDAAPTPLKKQKEFVLEPKNKNRTSWSDEDLKKRLEQVVNEDAEDTARLRTRAWVRMAGSATSPVKDQGESLKARYDFGKSLNSTWSPSLPVASPPPSVAHYMPRTPPTGASSLAPAASSNAKPTARVPFPPKNDAKPNMNLDLRLPTPRTLPRGSPRDIEGQSPTHHARFSLEVDDDESYGPQLPPLRLRNHTRSSYFDGWNTASPMFLTGGAKVTSPTRSENDNTSGSGPGTPVMRYNSFPMDNNSRSQLGPSEPWRAPSPVGSLASTPSVTSASSPSHSPSSPSESLPSEDPLSVIDLHAASAKLEGESDNRSAHNSESYHTFLDQFCFFRGPTATPAIDFTPRRTHSASELEQLASTSPFGSPRSGSEPQFGYTLGSYNGMLNVSSECLSGQVTPTNNASPLCGTQAKGECLTPRPGTPSDFANTSPSATPRIVAGF